jgi:hypothetical protein
MVIDGFVKRNLPIRVLPARTLKPIKIAPDAKAKLASPSLIPPTPPKTIFQ